MTIPVREPEASWSRLDQTAKKERLLNAAAEVFARDGLDASMPTIAAAAGAGVASIYRQFNSKRELLAALVVRRLEQVTESAQQAAHHEGSRWSALTDVLSDIVEQQTYDEFFGDAKLKVDGHPAVRAASERAVAALERVLAAARAEGRLRSDASVLDLRLLFAATRAARHVDADVHGRMLQLVLDGLDTSRV